MPCRSINHPNWKRQLTHSTGGIEIDTPIQSREDRGDRAYVQEIVVTAQKRSERINKVPLSVTAVTATPSHVAG